MKIGLIQMACSPDSEENLQRAVGKVEEAAKDGAKIICLPELFRSHYFCQQEDAALFDLAESIPGPSTEALSRVAKTHGVTILVSVFERRTAGVYHNSLAVLDERGEIAGLYRKMHVPDDPSYYEKFYFTPGDRGFQAVKTTHATVGPLICWDQWYPEAARMTALQGAEILLYPTAIGLEPYVTLIQERITFLSGSFRYLIAALIGAFDKPNWEMHLEWEGGEYSGLTTLVTVGNSPLTGGIFYMTPHANPFDGLLTFVYGFIPTRRGIFSLLPRTMKPGAGSYVEHPEIHEVFSPWLRVRSKQSTPAHADGEVFSRAIQDLEYQVIPSCLPILMDGNPYSD
jgi:hypothetical protein